MTKTMISKSIAYQKNKEILKYWLLNEDCRYLDTELQRTYCINFNCPPNQKHDHQ